MLPDGLDAALHMILLTALLVITIKCALLFYNRHRIKAKERYINQRKSLFTTLYAGVNSTAKSVDFREQHHIEDDNYVYGEVLYTPFAEILHIVNPQPGEIFYDLGCGGGKAVFATAVLHDQLDIRGIECLEPLYNICQERLAHFEKLPGIHKSTRIQFYHGDFLEYDFTDGNIVFLNATCFKRQQWFDIVKKLEKLPKGARVFCTTKKIDSASFSQIHTGLHLMSWGYCSVNVYKKTC